MANGKAKGSEFERFVSKSLSKWWSKGERDDLFWRTQSSGGRFTQRKKKGIDTHHQGGDVCNVHPESELFSSVFYVECKNYKCVGLWSIITGKGMLLEWWRKAFSDATQSNKIPLLIVKENNRPILVFTSMTGMCNFGNELNQFPIITFRMNEGLVFSFLFDDFLKFDIDLFKQMCEKIRNYNSEISD